MADESKALREENIRLREENANLQTSMSSLQSKNLCFETVMGIIADGFLVVGRDGNVIDINTAYCDYFGVRREDVIGRSVYKIIPNTKMIEIMDKDLVEIDAIHEFPKTLTASGEYKVAVTRLPVKNRANEIFASVALIKFSRYTNKLVQSLQEMGAEIEYYRKELSRYSIARYSFDALPTSNQVFRESKLLAERFARSDLPILLRGETGVGKEVFANAIHNASERRNGPFICLNCTSIPADLLESELFGYEEGAFTGGRRGGRRGKFELANQGTLLLDEIGDMPLAMQVKLLRVLQDNVIEKIGGERQIQVDVRILTATNQNLEQKIENKIFREDLYYRLNVLPVHIPALRDRKEDIPSLTYMFLEELNQKYDRNLTITPETLLYLQRYAWPGNIRELKNVIGHSFMTTDKGRIEPGDLPPHLLLTLEQDQEGEALTELMVQQERDIIMAALRKHGFNCVKASRTLGIHRATLYSKMVKYNICIAELRDGAALQDNAGSLAAN